MNRREQTSLTRLELHNVTYTYPGADHPAVREVSFQFAVGEVIAITGPSASGKSTLGRLLKGLLNPDTGSIRFQDREDNWREASARQRLKYVGWAGAHPEIQIFAETVREEVAFGPRNQNVRGRELDERVRDALIMTGLNPDHFLERNPLFLSGGEKRRVALAGIIAMDYTWYVFDEPTAGLDYRGLRQIFELTQELKQKNRGVCWITHDEALLNEDLDHVITLSEKQNSGIHIK